MHMLRVLMLSGLVVGGSAWIDYDACRFWGPCTSEECRERDPALSGPLRLCPWRL